MRLCNDTAVYFGGLVLMATTCKWRGLAHGASSSAPTQDMLRQKCTVQESSCSQVGNPGANNFGCDVPANRAATVTDHSACIHDEIAAFLQAVNALPVCAARVAPPRARCIYPVGVKTSMTTLFAGSVTCNVLPEIEQLEGPSVWMFTFSVCP